MTTKDCYNELERVARILVEQKVGEEEFGTFRMALRAPLDNLATLRAASAQKRRETLAAKKKARRGK